MCAGLLWSNYGLLPDLLALFSRTFQRLPVLKRYHHWVALLPIARPYELLAAANTFGVVSTLSFIFHEKSSLLWARAGLAVSKKLLFGRRSVGSNLLIKFQEALRKQVENWISSLDRRNVLFIIGTFLELFLVELVELLFLRISFLFLLLLLLKRV